MSCAARQYGQAASTSVTHQWRRFVAPVWRSARRTYEGVQQFIDNARMSDRATVRGERGSCTPPEFIPGRVVSRFPEAKWIPLSYRHPSRCWRIETAGSPPTSVYLKVSPVRVAAGVADERRRLLWAAGKLPVPSVIDTGDDEGMAWMLLGPLPGMDGTDPLLLARPERLVRMLANALRQLHDFPPTACPFDFRLPTAMTHVESRLRGGQIDTTQFQLEYAHHTPETAVLALRRDLPAAEDLVITHGDYCAPNIVFDDDRLSGFVDVGALGVADRWRDLAVAIWSIERIGHRWEDLFLSTYGAQPDPARMRFFRLLYELAS